MLETQRVTVTVNSLEPGLKCSFVVVKLLDVQKHLRYTLENIPENKVASPDTLLRLLTELATENTIVTSTSGKEYEFNINEKMNDLNIKSLLLTLTFAFSFTRLALICLALL